jgi:succinate dehydrogenase/fumarate reductase-like Fe-S protein
MQIKKIAQSCQSGNKAKMTLGPLGSANVQKNFIVPDISRFMKNLPDYTPIRNQEEKATPDPPAQPNFMDSHKTFMELCVYITSSKACSKRDML